MNKAQLVKAADELNKLLFDDPEIDVKSGPKEMKAVMYEALTCLRTGDTVSKETVAVLLECDFPFDATFFEQIEKEDQDDVLSVLQTLGIWVNKEDDENPAEGAEEAEEAEEAEDIVEDTKEYSLEEEIDDAQSMKVLKDIVKVYDELKELRGILTKYKTKKALKAAMVAILTEAESAEIEEKEKPEKEKPKASEEEKKEETPKADKKDAPKTEKSVKQKVPGTPSNKEVVYLLWKAGEEKLEILYKAVEVNVKEGTVKSWVNQWKKGSNLPACAKK